jgi:organic radical activating enzyme
MRNNTFCILPWVHLCVRTDNTLKPCCRFLSDNPSNEFKTTLDDINAIAEESMNSDYFKNIRNKMLNGEKIKGCQKCYTQEENNISNKLSMRQHFNNKISINAQSLDNTFYKTKYIEMSIDNVCNLQCRMCDSKFSSKLQNRDKFLGNAVFKKLEPNFYKLSSLDLSELEEVKILGGEPFITPNFEKFIDFLSVNSNLNNITLNIATNGTKIPSQKIIKKLNSFKNIFIHVSLDAYDTANDYQRMGSSFEKVFKNSQVYQTLIENCKISYHSTISIITANKLSKTINFFEQQNCLYSVDFVRDPEYYSLLYSPNNFKKWILESNQDNELALNLLNTFMFQRNYDLKFWKTFIDTTEKLDKYYDIKLENYNYELYRFLKEIK